MRSSSSATTAVVSKSSPTDLNHHSARTKLEPLRGERRDGQRFEPLQAALPEDPVVHLFSGAVEVGEIGDVAAGEIREPPVEVPDSEVVQKLPALAGGIPFIADDLVDVGVAVGAGLLAADLRSLPQQVPLHRMAEEMDQIEGDELVVLLEVDPDLLAVQIAHEGGRNVDEQDGNPIMLLDLGPEKLDDLLKTFGSRAARGRQRQRRRPRRIDLGRTAVLVHGMKS